MYGEGGNADVKLIKGRMFKVSLKSGRNLLVSPLGAQSLSSKFDFESQLWRRARHHHRLGLRGLGEAVVLLLMLLVFFVLSLVNTVQT